MALGLTALTVPVKAGNALGALRAAGAPTGVDTQTGQETLPRNVPKQLCSAAIWGGAGGDSINWTANDACMWNRRVCRIGKWRRLNSACIHHTPGKILGSLKLLAF